MSEIAGAGCGCGSHGQSDSSCCGGAAVTGGVSHERSMGRLAVAMAGGVFVLNSYLLSHLRPDLVFASHLSAIIGAVVLATPIIFYAVRDLMSGEMHMDALVSLAIIASMIDGNFRIAGFIAFFLLISVIIENSTAVGAQLSIERLVRLAPKKARRILGNEAEEEVEAASLRVGDRIRIRPGENFPVDGLVSVGNSAVNQASITGESLPIDKGEGDEVFAGTVNLSGSLDVRVSRVGDDTTLGKVKSIILAAERSKTPLTKLIDKYIAYYAPTVLMMSALVWLSTKDLSRVVSLLIIACPCALILATPSAIVAAVSAAARLGILINNASILEVAARVAAIVFDKTGTLTKGELTVCGVEPVAGRTDEELLRLAASIERDSNHPIAKAVQTAAAKASIKLLSVSKITEFHGKGVQAEIEGRHMPLGASRLAAIARDRRRLGRGTSSYPGSVERQLCCEIRQGSGTALSLRRHASGGLRGPSPA